MSANGFVWPYGSILPTEARDRPSARQRRGYQNDRSKIIGALPVPLLISKV